MKYFAFIPAIAALALAAPADAALLNFTISGDYSASFELDSEPSPDFVLPGFAFMLVGVPGFPDTTTGLANLTFLNGDILGGFTIADTITAAPIFNGFGVQLYSGAETAPVFSPGVFALTELIGPGEYTLAISRVVVPEAPTWAMMIAGMGMLGAALRRPRVTLGYARR